MRVDLDQIEFYHGPSRPPLSTNAKSVSPNYAPAHVPRYLQQSFPTGLGFCPGPYEAPLGQTPPLTGTTHQWNIFDFEINHVYGPTPPEMTKDVGPPVTTDIPAADDILLDRGSTALASSEPVPSIDPARTISCPAGLNHPDPIPPDMRGDDLPDAVPDAQEMETSQLSCTPCVTAPEPTPEQANCVSSNLSVVGDFQQESAKRKLSTMEPSDNSDSVDYENDSEPSQTSNLGGNLCSRANKASGRAEDPSTAEDTPARSRPTSPPTARSTSKLSRARTTPSSKPPTSTRAAAAICKKRLRSGRGTGDHQDENTPYDTAQPCQKRKKRRPSIRPLSEPAESSVPISSHRSGAIQGVHGSAILTVESNTGLKPAYFFTFVPDPSPMLPPAHTAVIPPLKHTYTSDENALLVRLKEKEAMSWSEITTHFPGRNMSSLQVHYSTKLRHKVSSRSGRPKKRQ
ncbi:uncharacterized protein N7506_003190 [Penicillium brevicompactum]|uniref:uncharacterized protein n=1 Tax=Penicillium brevicompactum TaxID=5074 RepID=UPI002542580E|nr:uncharacterized protein N7506_003190 [Penicillium brevicompactum]KAJ5343366.1 hypothetical protein N7506_003190 [Penicillium brevicompactum]